MKKSVKATIICLVLLLLVVFFLIPRITIVCVCNTLQSVPQPKVNSEVLNIPHLPADKFLSLGYSQGAIDINDVDRIAIYKDLIDIYQHAEQLGYVFYPPYLVKNGLGKLLADPHYVTLHDPEQIQNRLFEDELLIIRTPKKSLKDALFVSRKDFLAYIICAQIKRLEFYDVNQITIFDAPYTKGFIYSGHGHRDRIKLYSKNSSFAQEIFIRSEKPEMARKAAYDLLSNYQFTIAEFPNDPNELRSIAIEALSKTGKLFIEKK